MLNRHGYDRTFYGRNANHFQTKKKENRLTLGIATTTNWNVEKKKEITGVLSNRHKGCRPRKITAFYHRIIVIAVKKNPKTKTSNITNNIHNVEGKVSHSNFGRKPRGQQYRFHTTRGKEFIRSKNRKVRLQFSKKFRDEVKNF